MRFYKQVWGIIWEFNSINEYLAFCAGRVLAWVLVIGAFLIYYFFIYEPTPYEKMIIEDNEPCDEYVLPEYARWSDDGKQSTILKIIKNEQPLILRKKKSYICVFVWLF